jgi:hypothetical protein
MGGGGEGSEPADNYTFFYGNGNANHHLGAGLFVHKEIKSIVKEVGFVNNIKSYKILRGHWCYISVLNVCAPTLDKSDDVRESFYEELEGVFNQFPKHHIKISL